MTVEETQGLPVERQTTTTRRAPATALVVAAFAAVYLIWGSTFLGIAITIQSVPPLLMSGCRWLVAGGLLYAVLRLRGVPNPDLIQWRNSAIVSALLLGIGNGGMSWSQQTVPSGITALVIAAVPLWMILFEWWRPQGKRPHRLVFLGLALGFVGVTLIIMGKDHGGNRVVPPIAGGVLLVATVSWAVGSIWARHARLPGTPLMAVAAQMLTAVPLLIGTSALTGEFARFHPAAITTASLTAFAYLTIFGSLVGFSCYAWLLQVSTPARVSTYAYVNPLIAVVLGRIVLAEPLPSTVVLAGVAILAGVVLITLRGQR